MKFNKKNISEEFKNAVIAEINQSEDKGTAIFEAAEKIVLAQNEDLVNQILADVEATRGNEEAMRQAGIRTNFTEEEKGFYNKLKAGAKAYQSVSANQEDIIPVRIIDATLVDVKQPSGITSLIDFAPAGVQKWLTASKSGVAAWGALTGSIVSELTAAISPFSLDANKLHAFCAIPKAIRDLEIGYVDKYFRAILAEAMQDGIAAGYLNGDGKVAPIGIMRKIGQVESDGTHSTKSVLTTITGFSPAQLAPVLKTLSKDGLRPVKGLTLVCNPLDEYQYVNPALYGDSVTGGFVQKTFLPINVIADANMTQGKAVFTMPGFYSMGFMGVKVNEYKEVGALDDVDYLIAKVYGNGRATDDNAAVVFDVTELVPYILKVQDVGNF